MLTLFGLCRLIVFLVVLFSLVTLHRAFHRHRLRAMQRQAMNNAERPFPDRIRIPFFYSRGSGPRPAGTLPGGSGQWVQGDHLVVEISPAAEATNTRRYREYEGGTPSVWGIDLERGRARRGGVSYPSAALRGGAIARPAGGVQGSLGGRRLFEESSTEALDLPRYEEPPPGYEKVMEEGSRLSTVMETNTNTGNSGNTDGEGISVVPSNGTVVVPSGTTPLPTSPPPAVIRDSTP